MSRFVTRLFVPSDHTPHTAKRPLAGVFAHMGTSEQRAASRLKAAAAKEADEKRMRKSALISDSASSPRERKAKSRHDASTRVLNESNEAAESKRIADAQLANRDDKKASRLRATVKASEAVEHARLVAADEVRTVSSANYNIHKISTKLQYTQNISKTYPLQLRRTKISAKRIRCGQIIYNDQQSRCNFYILVELCAPTYRLILNLHRHVANQQFIL